MGKEKSLKQSVLEKRYFFKDKDGNVEENWDDLCKRVANSISYNNEEYSDFYDVMYNYDFLPNSPVLMNAGVSEDFTMSACFVISIEDSMESIFEAVKQSALISKMGGGCGYNFSTLRPENSCVGSTNGVASGPLSFIKVFDKATEAVKQGGKRRGANMAVLRVDHPDIEKFIDAKLTDGQFCNFNFSVAITEEFMKAVKENEAIRLKFNDKFYKNKSGNDYVAARYLWNKICENAHKNGEPGVIFIDKINEKNILREVCGELKSVNPCGEQPLHPNECCIASGEKVLTENGWVNIEKVKPYDNVAVLSEYGSTFQKVNAVKNNGIKDVFELKTHEGYRVKATEDHRFLTINGWKEVKDLKENDKLVIPENIYGKINLSEDCKVDEMLGWIHGDGWTSERGTGLSFNKKDGDFKIKDRILSTFKEYFNVDRKPLRNDAIGFSIQTETYLVEDKLKHKGIKICRACDRELPDYIYNASNNSKINFLKGLFAADGSIGGKSKSQIILHSNSEKLVKDTQILLIGLGIKSTVYETEFKTVKRNNQYRLVITCEDSKKFISLIGFGGHPKEEQWRYGKDFKSKRFARVKEIFYCGKSEVFDISVPGKEHFIVNGLIAHNCVLGSINLSNMYMSSFKWFTNDNCKTIEEFHKFIDWNKLKQTIETAVTMLDNIIDKQKYPNEEFKKFHKANRKIGLGVMGFADLLIKLGVEYGCDLSFKVAKEIMKFINCEAKRFSDKLGKDRGFAENPLKAGISTRNATVTTIAPTGTLSIIAECSSGIEPNFDFKIIHNRMDGEHVTYHPLFEEWRNHIGGQKDNRFIKASEVSVENHIKMQAAFQKYTDNAVSKTINMSNDSTVNNVKQAYDLAYSLGCKGVTVYRDGSRDNQVLSSDKKGEEIYKIDDKSIDPEDLPEIMESKRVKVRTPEGDVFINISFINDKPYEIFIHSPADTKHSEIYEALARLISAGLRYGVPLSEILSQLRKAYTKYGSIMSIPHAICKAFDKSYLYDVKVNPNLHCKDTYQLPKEMCPDCNNILVEEEGCKKCYECGYTACG